MPQTHDYDHRLEPQLYTQKHHFVYQYGAALVELLDPQPGELILDLGCGTGELTNQISQSGAEVLGIDSSEALVVRAQHQFPGLTFYRQDATQLPDIERYDAVFSNAVLHWIEDQPTISAAMCRALKPGGRLVVEFGGKGNVQLIRDALRGVLQQQSYEQAACAELWYFPSVGEYTTLLERHGFEVQWAQHYARPTVLADARNGIKDWLRMFANSYLVTVPPEAQETVLNETQDRLRSQLYYDHQWHADYRRLRVVATKPAL